MKKLKPIIFSTAMVQALESGAKIMTRRVIKSQPFEDGVVGGRGWWKWEGPRPKAKMATGSIAANVPPSEWFMLNSPYGDVGDVLWVRETFREMKNGFDYKAEYPDRVNFRWTPSIHMPRKAARIFLEITDIKMQRLQDISDKDAQNEGVEHSIQWCGEHEDQSCYRDYGSKKESWFMDDAIKSFESLWKLINKKPGKRWSDNPWVWVISFKKLENDPTVTAIQK